MSRKVSRLFKGVIKGTWLGHLSDTGIILGDELFFAKRAYDDAEFEGIGETDRTMDPGVMA